ncbi:MAG TPA: type II secretion system protein GspM [Rhodoferax sp.]|nr:type II secretion system protein GspM [Rhodoferax sp.]
MNRFSLDRIALLQVLTVLALLLPVLGSAYVVWVKHQRVEGILAEIEPRHARLQGLMARSADLQAFGAKASAQLSQLTYPATQDATKSGNDAQQRIRALFSDSKLDIISIQVLPAKEVGKFDRIGISLRVEGNLSAIQAALSRLPEQMPVVVVEGMTLQTIGAVLPASIQRLGGQFNFSVFRVRP